MTRRRNRRNPTTSGSMLPLLLAGAGIALIVAGNRQSTPVAGLDGLKKKFKKAAKRVASVPKKVIAVHKTIAKKATGLVKVAAGGVMLAPLTMGKKLVRKVMKGKRQPAPSAGPGEEVSYVDENNSPITQAEYERRQAEYERISACQAQGGTWGGGVCRMLAPRTPVQPPAPSDTFQQPQAPAQQQPYEGRAAGGGEGPSSDDYYSQSQPLLPSAASTPEPVAASEAAPAPKGKFNPLLTIAAFAAVPVVLGLTGGK